MGTRRNERSWNILAGAAAIAGAVAARKVAEGAWRRYGSTEPPVNPADRTVSWGSALGWAVFAGVLAGVARTVGRRGAAAVWEKATGGTPPGIR